MGIVPSFKNQVVYQIYPRSFYDGNEDGTGDLRGIIEKLDYIASLGVTAIWISPCFKSPFKDGGYDISNYYEVDPLFGNNADLDELIKEAKKRNLRIILDLVVNHTSDQHPWFQEALKSQDNPYHDYYVWTKKPNDLRSVFGGPAYEYVPELDEYYLHLFAKEQPDLNWANPKLRAEIHKMMNCWLDRGVYGFREDVIENIGKVPEKMITTNGPMLHPYLHEIYEKVFKGRDAFTVGECWDADNVSRTLYTDPKREELNMVFQFAWFKKYEATPHGKFDRLSPDLHEIRDIIFAQQETEPEKSWNANFLSNHDLPRPTVFFARPGVDPEDIAKFTLSLNLFLSGTPFIYQGEEIAMGHPHFDSLEELRDVEELNHYKLFLEEGIPEDKAFQMVSINGRDNSRTPMQWSDAKNGGFSAETPWIKVGDYHATNVEKQEKDPGSTLNFLKKAIKLRQSENILPIVRDGSFKALREYGNDYLAFERKLGDKRLVYLANIADKPLPNPLLGKKILLQNKGEQETLPPFGMILIED